MNQCHQCSNWPEKSFPSACVVFTQVIDWSGGQPFRFGSTVEGLDSWQEINLTQDAFGNMQGGTLDTERKWELDTIQAIDAGRTVATHAAGFTTEAEADGGG
jgi:hypothetical protein